MARSSIFMIFCSTLIHKHVFNYCKTITVITHNREFLGCCYILRELTMRVIAIITSTTSNYYVRFIYPRHAYIECPLVNTHITKLLYFFSISIKYADICMYSNTLYE